MSEFIEYLTQGGERWRAERGRELLALFGIEDCDVEMSLPRWHVSMSAEPTTWWVIRRLFAVCPLLGVEDTEELRVWSDSEILERLSAERGERLPSSYVQELLDVAVEHWEKYGKPRAVALPTSAFDEPTKKSDAEDEMLLRKYGFRNVEDEDEKLYILDRLTVFAPWLENGQTKAIALLAIKQEVHLFFSLDPSIQIARRNVRNDEESNVPNKVHSAQLDALQKSSEKAMASLKEMMETLGMTEEMNPSLSKKMAFKDAISEITLAIQQYKSNGDNTLIDGMFTAAEVKLLITPQELRPPQYRPDVVLSGFEALEHLWEKDWKPTPIQRSVHRKLLSVFQRSMSAIYDPADAAADPVFGPEDGTTSGDATDEPADVDDARADEAGTPYAPMLPGGNASATSLSIPPPVAAPRAGGGSFCFTT